MKMMTTVAAILAMSLAALADDSRAEAIRKLETMKVSVDFEEVKLPEALDYLRDFTGLNLVLLPKAMEKDADMKVRLKVRDLSVKSVLKLLLAPRGLTVTYRDGAIVVVPREDLQDSSTMKMFDVRALQVKIQDFIGPVVELTGAHDKNRGPSAVITLIDEPKTPIPDEFLLDMIRSITGNGSWDSNPRAAISLNNGMLVVSQTPSVLREIDRILGLLGQYQ